MRPRALLFSSLTLSLLGCGDVVKGSVQGSIFEEVQDVTFDVDIVGAQKIGMAVLYGGARGFCLDLGDAISGDRAAFDRLNSTDQLIIISTVGSNQEPHLVDAAINPDLNNPLAGPLVFANLDPAHSQFNGGLGFNALSGTVSMDFDTGEGRLEDAGFGGSDFLSVKIVPLNVRCAGMVKAFFE